MKRTVLLFMSFALFVVSCKKDAPDVATDAFEYKGKSYATLQEAVDAAVLQCTEARLSDKELLSLAPVKVNHDITGDGARIQSKSGGAVAIDFGSHKYTLSKGGSICTGPYRILLQGDGGGLLSCESDAAIVCEAGSVMLAGALDINASLALKARKSLTILHSTYSGSFDGAVSLDSARFDVRSSKAKVHITELEMPSDASIQVMPEEMQQAVVIDRTNLKLSSTRYPICANSENSIKVLDGTAVHVHNFEKTTKAATCISGETISYECKDCGMKHFDPEAFISGQEKRAHCDADKLVHHEAIQATQTRAGSIEYWQCPSCGKRYLDSKGILSLEVSPILRAGRYNFDQSVFNYGDMFTEIFRTPANEIATKGTATTILGIIGDICGIAGMGVGIAGLFSGDDYSGEFDAINEQLDEIEQSLEQQSEQLEDISSQIDAIGKQLVALNKSVDEIADDIDDISYNTELVLTQMSQLTTDVEATMILTERHNAITSLRSPTESAFYSLSRHSDDFNSNIAAATTYADSVKACRKFVDNFKNLVMNIWNGTYEGAKTTSDLMTQYTDMSYGTAVTFPDVLQTYSNSHVDWEHQSYPYRLGTLEEEKYVLGMAFGMLQLYYCFSGDHYFMEDMLNKQSKQNDEISELTEKDIEEMKACYNDYRLYNPSSLKLTTSASTIDYERIDQFCFFDTDHSFKTNDTLETSFHSSQGIIKEKCLTEYDVDILKSSWENSGTDETFTDYLFKTGIGGLEFFNGTGNFVAPFAETYPYMARATDFEELSYYNDNIVVCYNDLLTFLLGKKMTCGSDTKFYDSIQWDVTYQLELSAAVIMGSQEVLYESWDYGSTSIRSSQPDCPAYNCCTLQYY